MSVIINTVFLMHGNGTDVPNTQSFNAVVFVQKNNIKRIQETALSQRTYEHTLAVRRQWDLVISANELSGSGNEKLAWLENFWIANQRFLRTDTTDTDDVEEMTWTRVTTGDGLSPREQIAGHKLLSQMKFELLEALI